ncbi:MAG: trimethylamine methyltransferase family protein, partial [Victivallaceae bacterium]
MKNINRPEAEAIHRASLELLENPGCRLEHEGIRQRLIKAGALETSHPEVLRFPRKLVEELLALAPREVRFDGRGNAASHTLTPDSKSIVWSVPGMNILENKIHRPFTSRDMGRMAALFDTLDQIDGVFGMSLADVEPQFRDVAGLLAMAENTGKHLRVLCLSVRGGEKQRSILDAFPGNWFRVGYTAHGP